jgi:hypothetical protein
LKYDDFIHKPTKVDQGLAKQLTIKINQKQKTCKNGTKNYISKNQATFIFIRMFSF